MNPARESAVRVGLVYPELLGTYGDRGNAVVLVERARRRDIAAEMIEINAGTAIPDSLDIYLFGGGEDDAQVMAAAGMRASRDAIGAARASGAVIFAVCAGFQLLGESYEAGDGDVLDGLGLVDMATRAGEGRLIGEAVIEPDPSLGLSTLSGFENHGGRTRLGAGERPLGRVTVGHGNGNGVDGVFGEHLVGTYLHGPALPRNPELADLLLGWVVGPEILTPIDDTLPLRLRAERLHDAGLTGWRARRRDWHLHHG